MPLKTTSFIVVFLLLFNAVRAGGSDSAESVKPSCFPYLLEGNEKYCTDYVLKFARDRRGYLIRTWAKGRNFFPKISSILKKHNVPEEFRVLIALESGFNGKARSKAGAYGYWQFMDDVAKEYGLRIAANKGRPASKGKHVVDDRTNFTRSTSAAAKYLRDRMRNLNNDPLLIAASYNWGVGNVWNAMEKCGKTSPTFWDIKKYMPAETRSYVMNFIALNVIFHNYDAFLSNSLVFEENIMDESAPMAISK